MKSDSKKISLLEDETFLIDSRGMTEKDKSHISKLIAADKSKRARKSVRKKANAAPRKLARLALLEELDRYTAGKRKRVDSVNEDAAKYETKKGGKKKTKKAIKHPKVVSKKKKKKSGS